MAMPREVQDCIMQIIQLGELMPREAQHRDAVGLAVALEDEDTRTRTRLVCAEMNKALAELDALIVAHGGRR